MPQMSPIMWMVPISMLLMLMLSIKSNLAHTKENENLTKAKPLLSKNVSWKW